MLSVAVVRPVLVYVVYFAVVAAALTYGVGLLSNSPPVALRASTPTAGKVVVSISIIDGTPEQTVFCETVAGNVANDTLTVYSGDEVRKLMRDLGCES